MRQKVVLVDMDGVLVDLLPTWLRVYGEATGDWIFADDVTEYNFEQFVDYSEAFYDCLATALREAPPTAGASAFQKLIDDERFDVYVVTYAHESAPEAWQIKLEWLERYFPGFDRNRVIFTKHKSLVDGDVLIEDCEENIEKWQAAHPFGAVYLIDQPYNFGLDTVDAVVAALTMEEGT